MRSCSLVSGVSRKFGFILVMLAAFMAAVPVAQVQADAIVSPVRAYLDQDMTRAKVVLHNPSKGARTYRLQWVENRMDEQGAQAAYGEGEVLQHEPASPYLRFSPRQVRIQPGTTQTVRIDFRPSASMAPGEYRSHLKFSVMPDVSEPTSISTLGSASKGMSVKLAMQMSVSIPVIVRYQVPDLPQVELLDIERIPAASPAEAEKLSVTIQRSGAASSYGRVLVEMQRGPDAPVERIGDAGGINVYADSAKRKLEIPLRQRELPSGAWLRVAYEGMGEYDGNVFAEQTFQLP